MLSVKTFYLSRILGKKAFFNNQKAAGKLLDLVEKNFELTDVVIINDILDNMVKSRRKRA